MRSIARSFVIPHLFRPARSTLALTGLLSLALASTAWVRLNVSPSVPYGLYLLHAVPSSVARGTLVLLPVPTNVQHVWSRWLPLLKPVAGVAGDYITTLEGTLSINGVSFGVILPVAHGQPLPQIPARLRVAEGEVFLASPTPGSLDSRYFASVPLTRLTAVATPLWIWR